MPFIKKNFFVLVFAASMLNSLAIIAMAAMHSSFLKSTSKSNRNKASLIDSLKNEISVLSFSTDVLYNKVVTNQDHKNNSNNSTNVQTLITGLSFYYVNPPKPTSLNPDELTSYFLGRWCLLENVSVGDTVTCVNESPKYAFFPNGSVLKSVSYTNQDNKNVRTVTDFNWSVNGNTLRIEKHQIVSGHALSEFDYVGNPVTIQNKDVFYIGDQYSNKVDVFLKISN